MVIMHSKHLRCLLTYVFCGFLFFNTGCSRFASFVPTSPNVPSQDVRQHLGVLAIVPAQFVPESNLITFAKNKGAGTAKGATTGGGVATGTVAVSLAPVLANPVTAPFAILAGAVFITGMTTTGAVIGYSQALPSDTALQIETVINEALSSLRTHAKLTEHIERFFKSDPSIQFSLFETLGPKTPTERSDYSQLRTERITTVLEVAITEIGFESFDPEDWVQEATRSKDNVALFLLAKIRLVRVSDGEEIFKRQFRYASPRRRIQQWSANDGLKLAEEFDLAYRDISERIFDEIFLVTSLDLPVTSALEMPSADKNSPYGICWLAPIYPELDKFYNPYSPPPTYCSPSALLFITVNSVKPIFRWSEFPRDIDHKKLDPKVIESITNIKYDLKIWEAEGCDRGRLVYKRSDLDVPEHLVEESLPPASRYFWSVRARFMFNGQNMATRWAFFDPNAWYNCYSNDIHNWQYYRFITPP